MPTLSQASEALLRQVTLPLDGCGRGASHDAVTKWCRCNRIGRGRLSTRSGCRLRGAQGALLLQPFEIVGLEAHLSCVINVHPGILGLELSSRNWLVPVVWQDPGSCPSVRISAKSPWGTKCSHLPSLQIPCSVAWLVWKKSSMLLRRRRPLRSIWPVSGSTGITRPVSVQK